MLADVEFRFTRSKYLDRALGDTVRNLIKDFDKVKSRTLAAWTQVSSNKSKEKRQEISMQDEEGINLVLKSVTGRELTISLVKGLKIAYLYGFKGVALRLGFKDGDKGKKGTFSFKHMSQEAFERAKKAASKVSKGTLDIMLSGDSSKFKRKNLKAIIMEGIKEGKPATEVAEKIGELFDKTKFWKAAEITRTEIPLAYNLGRIDAARRDGLIKARIELGGNPCSWCVDNHINVTTLDEAEEYMSVHHPNNNCTVIPLVSFDYYGIEPPPGYESGEEGPLD